MQELTRSISLPTPRKLTLTFPDRSLEQKFQHSFAAEALGRYRFLIGMVLVLWLGFGTIDHVVVQGSALTVARVLRFGIVGPMIVAIFALSYAPRTLFTRLWQPCLAVGYLAIAMSMIYFRHNMPMALRPTASGGIALVIISGYTLVMMRFTYAITTSLVITIALAVTQIGAPVPTPVPAAFQTPLLSGGIHWVYLANIIGIVACRELESFRRTKFVQRMMIEHEQARSEALLANTLPASVVQRLKRGADRVVDGFDSVTVLFGDIVGFTDLADALTPRELVDFLNELYSAFDEIAERHGLEKIKTVGDAYMVIGGAPVERADHADAVAHMALDMLDAATRCPAPGGQPIALRIGIHSGPVVAGVIGNRKLTYDVWGDTVNIASRLESHGLPGAIQVSQSTRDLLGDSFSFEARGRVELKGKGATRAYLLTRRADG